MFSEPAFALDSSEVARGFPGGISGKEPTCQCGRYKVMGVRSPGERHGNPLQYSCLENPMDRRAWWAAVRRVPQSRTRLKRVSTYDCTSEVPVGFGVLFCFIFLYIVCPSYTFWQASPAGKLHLLASFTCSQASPAGKLHLLASFTCSQASHAHKLHMLTSFTCSQAPGVGDGQGKPGVLQSMGSQRVKHS